jgi:hypothetical protein
MICGQTAWRAEFPSEGAAGWEDAAKLRGTKQKRNHTKV